MKQKLCSYMTGLCRKFQMIDISPLVTINYSRLAGYKLKYKHHMLFYIPASINLKKMCWKSLWITLQKSDEKSLKNRALFRDHGWEREGVKTLFFFSGIQNNVNQNLNIILLIMPFWFQNLYWKTWDLELSIIYARATLEDWHYLI